jgi:hypothetical protein
LYATLPIYINPFGKLLIHAVFSNALLPIFVIVSGNIILERLLQSVNALPQIFVILLEISIFVILLNLFDVEEGGPTYQGENLKTS